MKSLQEAPKEVYDMFAGLLHRFEQDNRKREEAAAQKDPLAHKLTRVMKDTSYRYYNGGRNQKGSSVLFCWTTHRNAAGFFLGWREVHFKSGKVKRDKWLSRRKRSRCKSIALRRMERFKAAQLVAKMPPGDARAEAEGLRQPGSDFV